MAFVLKSGCVYGLAGSLGVPQRIYTRGDVYGSAVTFVTTPAPPALGGDDVYRARFAESASGQSYQVLTPNWAQSTTGWMVFGAIVQFETTWPVTSGSADLRLAAVESTGGVEQAGIYAEATSGDIYLADSAGVQACSISNPVVKNVDYLIVGCYEPTNSGASKLYVYDMSGNVVASDTTGAADDFQTATGLTLRFELQGQTHGGSPYANPTHVYFMNPFCGDAAAASEHPTRIAGLLYANSDANKTSPWKQSGAASGDTMDSGANDWDDTGDESATLRVKHTNGFLNTSGGMNEVDGPLGDSRLDGAAETIWGGGILLHTDCDRYGSYTDVSAGRKSGGAIAGWNELTGSTWGGQRNSHGGILIVDGIAYDDELAGGHKANTSGKWAEINAMRGFLLVTLPAASGVPPVDNLSGNMQQLTGGFQA